MSYARLDPAHSRMRIYAPPFVKLAKETFDKIIQILQRNGLNILAIICLI